MDIASPPAPRSVAPRAADRREPALGSVRIRGIDGLRAIAVLAVMVFHLSPGALPGGYIGVDVFFVISGFLITKLLVREKAATGRIRLGAFWIRRARRLLPALVTLILVSGSAALLVASLGGRDVLIRLGSQVVGAVTFSSNWLFIGQGSSYFDDSAPELFRNLWSLAVEEQFYLLWPFLLLVILLLPRRARVPAILLIAAGSLIAMATLAPVSDATRVYYGTDTHSFGLALGAALAVVVHGWVPDAAGWAPWRRHALGGVGALAVLGILALTALLPEASPLAFTSGLGLVAVLSTIAIAALSVPGSALGKVLDLAPARWIGMRSYGLYLWHWPVWVLLTAAIPAWPREGAGGWVAFGVATAITFGAATLSYRFVEQPIRQRGILNSAAFSIGSLSRGPLAATAGALAIVLVGAAVWATALSVGRDPGRSEAQVVIEAGQHAVDARADGEGTDSVGAGSTATAPSASPTPTAAPESVGGDQIVAIGDSVTLAAAPELQTELPGIAIDAAVSRQMSTAPALVAGLRDAGALRPVLVLALGTNGPIDRSTLDEVRKMLGPDRELVLVTAQAPRGWIAGVNDTLASYAREYRNVELADWSVAIQPSLDLLARDQVHFGSSGARIWTASLAGALQRLAELPPLRDARDYESIPRPT